MPRGAASLITRRARQVHTTVVIARGEMVRDDPEAIKNMILALREGWRAARLGAGAGSASKKP